MMWSPVISALIFGLLTVSTARAADKGETPPIGTYDFVVIPQVSQGFGNYKLGGLDSGNYSPATFGVRSGLKLGALFLGGEYVEGHVISSSDSKSITAAQRSTHPDLRWALQQSWGWTVGLIQNRFAFWYTHYGYDKIKQSPFYNGEQYNFAYVGAGDRAELGIRVFKGIYFSGHYRIQTFDRYTSSLSTQPARNEPMDMKLKTSDWGVNLSVILPLSKAFEEFFKFQNKK